MIPAGPRLGDVVIEAEHLRKGYGDRLLIDDLEFRLPPGGIVGVIGPNGAGKTTLFRMITGQEEPDAGSLRIGPTVVLGYVDQSRDALDPKKSVWEEISGGRDQIELGRREIASRAYVAAFNFKGPDQQQKVGQLSPSCSRAAPTSSCSMSRPTTSTSTPCARSRTRCWSSPAAPW
jgi:sulfate-transporting ATPase